MHSANADCYEVPTLRCHACHAQAQKAKEFSDNGGDLGGLHFAARLIREGS